MTLLKAIQGAVFCQGAAEGFHSSVDSTSHCSLNTEVNTLPRWPTRLTSERATGRGTTINPRASENQFDTDLTVNKTSLETSSQTCVYRFTVALTRAQGNYTGVLVTERLLRWWIVTCDEFEMQQEASTSWQWVDSHLLPVSFTFTLNQTWPSNSLYPSIHQLGHLYLCIWELLLNKMTYINV